MKKKTKLLAALILCLGLLTSPAPLLATIGDVGTGTDANGVYFQREWNAGNWSEFYSIGGSYWSVWIDEGGTGAAGNETGNFYTIANLVDGTTTAYQYETFMNGLSIEEFTLSNSATGFYERGYDYNDQSGTAGAYREMIDVFNDPLSGEFEDSYERWVDMDGDGFFGFSFNGTTDDWYYRTWNEWDPGTGWGDEGYELYNYVDNVRNYNDRDYNTVTGYYDIDIDFWFDADDDGFWTDNYYTEFDDYYYPYSGYYRTESWIYDYDGVFHASAYYYNDKSSRNVLTGGWDMFTDARFDADGDGSWSDFGPNQGAYRDYTQQGYSPSDGNTYSNSVLWDTINSTYTSTDNWSYANNGDWGTTYQFAMDTDADGVVELGDTISGNWGGDDFWNYNQTSYDAWNGRTRTTNWTSDDQSNARSNYWYTSVVNSSRLTGSYDNLSKAKNLGGYAEIHTGYDGDEGYRYETIKNATFGVSATASAREWWDAGDWEIRNFTNFDTDGDSAWDNPLDYEVYTETWEESSNGWYIVGYEVEDYDSNNYFFAELASRADLSGNHYITDTGWNGTPGERNEMEMLFAPGVFAGTSEWWYDTPAPNAYEKWVYSGSANSWYLTYYN